MKKKVILGPNVSESVAFWLKSLIEDYQKQEVAKLTEEIELIRLPIPIRHTDFKQQEEIDGLLQDKINKSMANSMAQNALFTLSDFDNEGDHKGKDCDEYLGIIYVSNDQVVHYNVYDFLAILDHFFRSLKLVPSAKELTPSKSVTLGAAQVYFYDELQNRPLENAFTLDGWPKPVRPILDKSYYHDGLFAEQIFMFAMRAQDLIEEDQDHLSDAFYRYLSGKEQVHCLPMPKYFGLFPYKSPTSFLFLDRDGVINKDKSYVYKINDCEIIPEIYQVMTWGKEKNKMIAVVTNQSGIGRGMYTVADTMLLHDWMRIHFHSRNLMLSLFEMCPYHHEGPTQAPFSKYSLLRKPLPGMVLKVGRQFPLNLRASLMIGDKYSDYLWMPLLQTILIKGNYDLTPAPGDGDASLAFRPEDGGPLGLERLKNNNILLGPRPLIVQDHGELLKKLQSI